VEAPLAPGRYKVQFTASAALREKLERLQDLMRASVPDGDLAAIIDQAVTEKLARLEARRFAQARKPRKELSETDTSPRTRQIPAAVKRAVYERDGGRCRFVDACRGHNGLMAEADYGRRAMALHRGESGGALRGTAVLSL
jgi:hypothetical protein